MTDEDSLVALRYPNGRIHQTVLTGRKIEPGEHFELYGRQWRATEPIGRRLLRVNGISRVDCVPVSD